MKLKQAFFQREDVDQIAKELLGKILVTNFDGQLTSGKIVETESYAGVTDKASHAYSGRRTKRTEIMYGPAGTVYVYLIYGIYSLFNIVTNKNDIPHAVLIRAIEPVDGINKMLERRKMERAKYNLSAGPGLLTQALGISTIHNAQNVMNGNIWVEDHGLKIHEGEIISRPRVGVAYAEEDAKLLRRFSIKDNPWVSKAK
ncbi:MAG: DNA-3-methyladenine glycosylase [Calditrichaeota bacterium]|nr:MAG: DNA-3-methyladenine glycosylase [Calditrichota bacterium]MBL1206526.1 DNA-3-methyladenine glycosylase [Calditrichota bacterium]NOG46353.1 DNA-3-methyladenine glycosylase [Calditrichota bacterium]